MEYKVGDRAYHTLRREWGPGEIVAIVHPYNQYVLWFPGMPKDTRICWNGNQDDCTWRTFGEFLELIDWII